MLLGIVMLAAALSRFFLVELTRWEQGLALVAALFTIAPGIVPTLIGLALVAPVVLRQVAAWRRHWSSSVA